MPGIGGWPRIGDGWLAPGDLAGRGYQPQPRRGKHRERRHDDRADRGHHVHSAGERRASRPEYHDRALPGQLPSGVGGTAPRVLLIARAAVPGTPGGM